ncbi:MAG: hypothetical protein HYS32_02085 [Candidatus Woesearchaeota archaeon]|nr:MAG: hypothetical protein HYS32_02085 [Candidatus Woesearchaeota archaeon]
MAIKEPESMDDCVYFTNRLLLEGKGHAKAWVYRKLCPKCSKSLMGKPLDAKGKPKIRAEEYQCPSCKYTVNKEEYEDTLQAEIKYTCPYCQHNGEYIMSFKRKKVQFYDEIEEKKKTVDALKFECEKCKKDIIIAKKMKV